MTTIGRSCTAAVAEDPNLQTTVITLRYKGAVSDEHDLEVCIAPELGSNMFRFRAGTHEIIQSDDITLKACGFTGNFVLWPLPNRVRDKRYSYRGQTYSLAEVTRPSGNAVLIHGLVFDRPWRYDTPVVTDDAARVTTSIEIGPESPQFSAYPFPSRLSLTYTLTSAGVTIGYQVENLGDRSLPFGFALHPYFSTLSGPDSTRVTVPAAQVMEADDELLPTGRVLDVGSVMYGMFDLRSPRAISELRLDHVYTALEGERIATIQYGSAYPRMRIQASAEFSHMVIYTPPQGDYFCLENQTCATDAVNLHDQGLHDIAHLVELAPGESTHGTIQYVVEYTT